MCGIVGFLVAGSWRGRCPEEDVLTRMAAAIAHRGPDDSGTWIDREAGIGLGHRRLAIVDLSPGGHQPMVSASGHVVMVFNGEIYNHSELRSALESEGSVFRSASDTEVLLEGLARWGAREVCRRAVGMFAFAAWDRQARTLWLARDRLGKKPLYVYRGASGVAFASELKSLWQMPGFSPTLDPEGLAEFLRHGYIPEHVSVFREVCKVLPGTVSRVNVGGDITSEPYWSLGEAVQRSQSVPIRDLAEARNGLLPVLRDATRIRMLADVPLGAFLSGGIDSGLVVALMQEASTARVRTYSIGFQESLYNEAPVAEAVAKHLGTDHTTIHVTERDALDVVPRLSEMFDEPFADASQIPTYLLSALTRRHVTVALTGDGGDESFGGYARYRSEEGLVGALYGLPSPARSVLASALDAIPQATWDGVTRAIPARKRPRFLASKVAKLSRALRLDSSAQRSRSFLSFWEPADVLLHPEASQSTEDYAISPDLKLAPSESMQYWETLHYLPGDLLAKVDRASMAASLEARSPLLDHRVVEFAWRLSPDLKASRHASKRILRELLFSYVPREIIDLPKQGFSVPIGQWMTGYLRDWTEHVLSAGRRDTAHLIRWPAVDLAWAQHLSGRTGQAERIWSVVVFCAWYCRWMHGTTN